MTNSTKYSEIFDSVVVCNGRYSIPKLPSNSNITGLSNFNGKIIHSHDYRSPDSFEAKNVVIVGAGPSGIDISIEIAAVDGTLVNLCHLLPDRFRDLPRNIIQHSATIKSMDGSTVHLTNGKSLNQIDAVIFATGYLYDFNFLDKSVGINVTKEGRVENIYLHLININDPTMFIFAIPQKILPFPLYHQQACLIKKVLMGDVRLPPKEIMIKETNLDWERRAKLGIPERHSHKMSTSRLLWEYDDHICSIASIDPIKPIIRTIFESLHIHRKNNSLGYKELKFKIIDDDHVQIIQPSSSGNDCKIITVSECEKVIELNGN